MEQLKGKEAKQQRLQKRNQLILRRYKELSEQKRKGKKVNRTLIILDMLSEEFFLSPRTIEGIIFNKETEL